MKPQLLIAMALVAVAVVPANAEQAAACDNRSFFTNQLLTIPAGHPEGPRVANFDDLSIEERAVLDNVVDELAHQSEGVCMAEALANAEKGDGFAVLSSHLLVYESVYGPIGFDDLRCSGYSEGSREKHHYHEAHPVPSGHVPSSRGNPEYAGWATSPMPTTRDPNHFVEITAFVHDLRTGRTFTYDSPIVYGGVSDFYCFAFFWGFISTPWSVNMPSVTGFANNIGVPT